MYHLGLVSVQIWRVLSHIIPMARQPWGITVLSDPHSSLMFEKAKTVTVEAQSPGICNALQFNQPTSLPQMTIKNIFDDHPGRMDRVHVIVLSSIEKRLRVTVVRTRVNQHLIRSICPFHAG